MPKSAAGAIMRVAPGAAPKKRYGFETRVVRSPYFAKPRRERKPAKWKIEALAAATGSARLPWEGDAAYTRRLAREHRATAARGLLSPAAAAVFGGVGGGADATPAQLARALNSVKPLPDTRNAYIGVYLLQSIAYPSRTYTGFTVDVHTRLRQHNGELAGGAKYTALGRPWKLVMHVHGFRAQPTGLQFEAALIHRTRSRHARPLLAHAVLRTIDAIHNRVGLMARLYQLLMFAPHFCDEPLRVEWVDAAARAAHEIEFGDGDA